MNDNTEGRPEMGVDGELAVLRLRVHQLESDVRHLLRSHEQRIEEDERAMRRAVARKARTENASDVAWYVNAPRQVPAKLQRINRRLRRENAIMTRGPYHVSR